MSTAPASESETLKVAIGESSLGLVLIAETTKGIRAIQIGDHTGELRRELHERFPSSTLIEGDASTRSLLESVIRFIEAPGGNAGVSLDIRGTEFQRTVWKALTEIPAGSTMSYSEVAQRIGKPKAVRAVAHACAENALAVIVPCHRVVRTDGGLSGYRWGVERKRMLLEREAEQRSV